MLWEQGVASSNPAAPTNQINDLYDPSFRRNDDAERRRNAASGRNFRGTESHSRLRATEVRVIPLAPRISSTTLKGPCRMAKTPTSRGFRSARCACQADAANTL